LPVQSSSTNETDHERLENFCRPVWRQSTTPASRHQHQQSDSQLVTGSLPSARCQCDHPATHHQMACNTTQCNTSNTLDTVPYIAANQTLNHKSITDLTHLNRSTMCVQSRLTTFSPIYVIYSSCIKKTKNIQILDWQTETCKLLQRIIRCTKNEVTQNGAENWDILLPITSPNADYQRTSPAVNL